MNAQYAKARSSDAITFAYYNSYAVCRENLEIGEPREFCFHFPSLPRFKSVSANCPETLSRNFLFLFLFRFSICKHIHAHIRIRLFRFSRFIVRGTVDTNDCQTEAGELSKYYSKDRWMVAMMRRTSRRKEKKSKLREVDITGTRSSNSRLADWIDVRRICEKIGEWIGSPI